METLLVDYQKSKRVNFFQDKRIEIKGDTEEEKAVNKFKLKHKVCENLKMSKINIHKITT